MSKWLIGIVLSLVSAALGVAAAYGGTELMKARRLQHVEAVQILRESQEWDGCEAAPGVNGRFDGRRGGRGMMHGGWWQVEDPDR